MALTKLDSRQMARMTMEAARPRKGFKLILSGVFLTLALPLKTKASEIFHLRAGESATLAGSSPRMDQIPFDAIELDLHEVEEAPKSVRLILWKNHRMVQKNTRFRVAAPLLPGSPHVLVYSDMDKRILIEVYPKEARLGHVEYLYERSIQGIMRDFWIWLENSFGGPAAVAAEHHQ